MRKLKLLMATLAMIVGGVNCALAQTGPTASTPVVGNTYYLYNPATKLFMTTNVDLPFVRPTGSAWKLENAEDHEGWVTLRLKDNNTDGCGYFWGKWWANNPAQNSNDYAGERVFKLVNISDINYKLQSYAWGETTAYIYINNGNEGDRSYRLACNSQEQNGLDEGYVTWQFISEDDYATYMADDYTQRIANNDFLDGINSWTLEGTGNKQVHGNTAIEYWKDVAANGSFDYYQNLTNLPAGKYVLRAAMFNSTNGEANASFDTAGQCGVYGTSNGVTKNANVTVDGTAYNIYTTDGLIVPDGNLRLGFKNSATMTARWFGVDWIQLTCLDYCLSTVATALPQTGEMVADTWYYYDLPTSDEYEFTSTSAATLTYSADGTQLISEVTGTESDFTASAAKTISLSAGRLYVKTNAATSLTISYKYNIGTATADASYIQAGKTVTVTWADATSNNPSASLKKDIEGVKFNNESISVTSTDNGFTFTVPAVTANNTYTLSIPSNVIGYEAGNIYNEEQSIVFNTPALFDGTYFLKVAATFDGTSEGESAAVGKYLARGTAYSTHVSLDSYGLPVTLTTNGDNVTNLKMADTNAYIFSPSNSNYDIYADGAATEPNIGYTVCMKEDKYLIASNFRSTSETKKYFKYNTSAANQEEISVFDDGTGTNNGPIILWTIESIAEHATAMQDRKNAQAEAAAVAAYESGNYDTLKDITTVSELESTLSSGYIEGVFVSPSEISSVEESYQPRNNNVNNIVPVTVYSNTIEITQAGFYKFSMQAFNRATWNANVQALHNVGADMPAAVLFFGDSETQIKSLYDEEGHDTAVEGADPADAQYNDMYYANCKPSALKMFKDDKYHNDVWFYCSNPGTYTYGVKVMGYAAGQWFIYSPESVTITSYAAAAADDDYTALQVAIDAYDNAKWGFEKDECAPYNNVAAIKNIAAAKAINKNAENSKLLVNSLKNYLDLTVNTEEVNAVNNITDGVAYNTAGWTRTQTWNNWRNPYYSVPAGTMTYGSTDGFTMPLKANTKYRLTFDHSKWDNSNADNGGKISVLCNGEGLAETPYAGVDGTKSENIVFTTGQAGNYVFSIVCESGRLTFGNVIIKKAVATPITIAKTDTEVPAADPYADVTMIRPLNAGWNAICLPFDVTAAEVTEKFGADSEVAEFTGTETDADNNVKLKFSKFESDLVAGTPYLLYVKAAINSVEFAGKEVKATDAQTVEGQTFNFVGNYTRIETDASPIVSGDYIVASDGKLHPAAGRNAINGYRAYFKKNTPAPARSVSIWMDGDVSTGINGVVTVEGGEENVYNLNGQRINTTKKGLYIKNGKKVVVR